MHSASLECGRVIARLGCVQCTAEDLFLIVSFPKKFPNSKLQIRLYKGGDGPFGHWVQGSAIQTSCHIEGCGAVWANRASLKSVERLLAMTALPIRSHHGLHLARRAGKSLAARQLGNSRQCLRLAKPTPAVQQYECGNYAQPNGLQP